MLSKNDELFLAIAKSGSISKAAEQLYISQPSLTKRMQQLENQLGVVLFDRKNRPLKLSSAGEIYYDYLSRAIVSEHNLLLDLREAAEGKRGKLSVGAPPNLSQCLFPTILPKFYRIFPQASLTITEGTGVELQALVAGRQLDIAFAHMPVTDNNVSYIHLSNEKIFLTTRRPAELIDAEPLFLFQSMEVNELPAYRYCLYNKKQMIYTSMNRFFEEYGIIPDVQIRSSNAAVNLTMVATIDNCATFIPRYAIGQIPANLLRKLIFYSLNGPELNWELCVMHRRGDTINIFAKEMIRLVKESTWYPDLR